MGVSLPTGSMSNVDLKVCTLCSKELPLAEFYRWRKQTKYCYSSRCKGCLRPQHAAAKRDNPNRLANYRKWRYGASAEQVSKMEQEQSGCCAICGESDAGKNLHLDHSHSSGKIRGLLCRPCNLGLGKFRDQPSLLVRAAEYLKREGYAGYEPFTFIA